MKSLRTTSVALAPLLALLLVGAPAAAAEPTAPAWTTKQNERRAGLVLGIGGGLAIGKATGYPNKASQIGDPAFYTSSGIGVGGRGTLFLMGALADSLSFGFWFGGGSTNTTNWRSSTFGVGFRIEAFPLYELSPRLRDFGLSAQLGLGATKITPLHGDNAGAEGVQSHVGFGAFYEWRIVGVFGGHLAGGPSLDYSAALSRSVDRHDLAVGGRLVLYTGL